MSIRTLFTLTTGLGLLLGAAGAEAALVAHWTLDDGSGTVAQDSTANDRDGKLKNGPTWISSGLPPVPSGTSWALDFDGNNDFVVANGPGGSNAYKGVTGKNPRSTSAWIKTTKNDAAILNWGTNSKGKKWTFRTQSNNGTVGAIRVEVNNGYQVGEVAVTDGQWHHVAAVLPNLASPNATNVRLYVDGQLQGVSASKGQAINTASNQNVRIGRDFNNDHNILGQMDEVRIYNHDLTSAEVRALAGAPADLYSDAVLADGAIAYWRLGEGIGNKVFNEGSLGAAVDRSYTGSPVQGVQGLLAASTNTAVHFDGTDDEIQIGDNGSINNGGPYATKSFELLFNADTVSGRQVLFEQGGTTNGFNLYLEDDELYFGAWTDNTFHSANTAALDLLAGTDYHVVGTWDNGDLALYVGGRLVASGDASADFTSVASHGDNGAIGGIHENTRFHGSPATAGNGYNFAGVIDEVALYNLALSEDQIKTHFLLSTPEPGTVVIWSLLAAMGIATGWRRRCR